MKARRLTADEAAAAWTDSGRRIYVEIKDSHGRHIQAFSLHAPFSMPGGNKWTAFYDDGKGNGDALGEEFDRETLGDALAALGDEIERHHF